MPAPPTAGSDPVLPPECPVERPTLKESHRGRDVRGPEPGIPGVGQHCLCRAQPLLAQVGAGCGPDPFEQGVDVADRDVVPPRQLRDPQVRVGQVFSDVCQHHVEKAIGRRRGPRDRKRWDE
jgi:hypothetical protein